MEAKLRRTQVSCPSPVRASPLFSGVTNLVGAGVIILGDIQNGGEGRLCEAGKHQRRKRKEDSVFIKAGEGEKKEMHF